jgi:FAD/FMN-containing dehydrogenase
LQTNFSLTQVADADTAALSARIREKFDPAGMFNPGRMV